MKLLGYEDGCPIYETEGAYYIRTFKKVDGKELLHDFNGNAAYRYKSCDGRDKDHHCHFINGIVHRDNDEPAMHNPYLKSWVVNGKEHREGKPSLISKEVKEYRVNGRLNRLDGPAIDGKYPSYWVNGVNLTEKFNIDSTEKLINYLNSEILK